MNYLFISYACIAMVIIVIMVIIYYTYTYNNRKIYEGYEDESATYTEYNPNMSVQVNKNTSNIEYLKEQMSKIEDLSMTVDELKKKSVELEEQLHNITQHQISTSHQLVGKTPAKITGAY